MDTLIVSVRCICHFLVSSFSLRGLVQADGSWVYTKVTCMSDQGVRNHTNAEATVLAGTNPDFLTQDLHQAIEDGEYPSWTVYVQTMTADQVEKYKCTFVLFRRGYND